YTGKDFSDEWGEAKGMYDVSRKMGIPLLCGSTVPLAWRRPPLEIPRGTRFTELLTTSYSDLEEHAYHAIELLQSIAERRTDGESGVARVRYCAGEGVWKLAALGEWSRLLLDAALARRVNAVPKDDPHQLPEAFLIRYRDGLKGAVLHVNSMT